MYKHMHFVSYILPNLAVIAPRWSEPLTNQGRLMDKDSRHRRARIAPPRQLSRMLTTMRGVLSPLAPG